MDDIVDRLRDTAYEAEVCWEAAAEIERLRGEIIAVRAERDSAQTQANHLAQRLVQEARRG